VGIVGGSIKTNPLARAALKILGVRTARELAEIMAAVGLANNFAALRSLATEGIQKGHMKLHAKNLAVLAGAKEEEIEAVAAQMVSGKEITATRAKKILEKIRQNNK
jgi:hydroxymethylglutaryl-CoA reductase